jgi:hypothetical protein
MKAKKFAKQFAGLGVGSGSSSAAVYIAGAGAKRVAASTITHGLKVLGLGSMGLGVAATGGIGILAYIATEALLDMIIDD